MKEQFKSKVDTWMIILLVLLVLTSAYGVYDMLLTEASLLSSITLFVAGIILPLSLAFNTKYEVFENDLVITCGFFRWKISKQDITEIKETKSILASPALSLNRLKITYRNNKAIIISPENKEHFIKSLNLV
mgnify:CR=1 FL=1